ncbi:murein L,D-transpeptidase catalytic domain family protein [Chitinophaga solisilvae]|uniref:murein L,D-transpeptidase catalytic domain family protein n=1 Tax=Chitinophaga solisilvae TaxID=1233460 RepID=UPI00136BCCB1|nr:murein L,D-transpeptidase catalytic domain family protein [Chitinophaga solisilvae]
MKLKWKKLIKPFIFVVTTSLSAFLITTITTTEKNTVSARQLMPADSTLMTVPVSLYEQLGLDSAGLSRDAFDNAMRGYEQLEEKGRIKNPDIISIIDYSLPSSRKRLFVIDLKNKLLLFNTLVSHGRNSGTLNANTFSNAMNSYKSSLGFFITGDTYIGEHGYSLRLQGEEAGINDNALSRGIVMHSAAYVNDNLIKSQGYIGRSLGCPAIPEKLHRKVIERIRNGTCLFSYSPDKYYSLHTKMLKDSIDI